MSKMIGNLEPAGNIGGTMNFTKGDKGDQGLSGVYVGSGEMPEGYNVQIVPNGSAFGFRGGLVFNTKTKPEYKNGTHQLSLSGLKSESGAQDVQPYDIVFYWSTIYQVDNVIDDTVYLTLYGDIQGERGSLVFMAETNPAPGRSAGDIEEEVKDGVATFNLEETSFNNVFDGGMSFFFYHEDYDGIVSSIETYSEEKTSADSTNGNLPTPYAWVQVDQTDGRVTASDTVSSHYDGATTGTKISDKDGYGICLTGDNRYARGFKISSSGVASAAAAGKDLTMLIEYYVNPANIKYSTSTLLSYLPTGAAGISVKPIGSEKAEHRNIGMLGETAFIGHTFTKAELAAIATGTDNFYFLGNPDAPEDAVYIKSIKVVDSAYVGTGSGNYAAYGYFTNITPYYPNVTAFMACNAELIQNDLYRGYKLYEPALIDDISTNRPMTIKVYTTENYEDNTVRLNCYEKYDERLMVPIGHIKPEIVKTGDIKTGDVLLYETKLYRASDVTIMAVYVDEVVDLSEPMKESIAALEKRVEDLEELAKKMEPFLYQMGVM